MEIQHIRVNVVPAGRRVNDAKGNPGRTICGAPITDRDLTVADARRLREKDIREFNVCQMCLARIPATK